MANTKIRDYACYNEEVFQIREDEKKKFEIEFPQAYIKVEPMSRLSLLKKEKSASPYCKLPFSNTLEAKAMGLI